MKSSSYGTIGGVLVFKWVSGQAPVRPVVGVTVAGEVSSPRNWLEFVAAYKKAFGSRSGDVNFNQYVDVNRDGVIVVDIV